MRTTHDQGLDVRRSSSPAAAPDRSADGDGESDSQETTADVQFDSAVIGKPAKVTATDGLHLRTGPGTGYAVIETMPHGATVNVVGGSGGWYKVTVLRPHRLVRRHLSDARGRRRRLARRLDRGRQRDRARAVRRRLQLPLGRRLLEPGLVGARRLLRLVPQLLALGHRGAPTARATSPRSGRSPAPARSRPARTRTRPTTSTTRRRTGPTSRARRSSAATPTCTTRDRRGTSSSTTRAIAGAG